MSVGRTHISRTRGGQKTVGRPPFLRTVQNYGRDLVKTRGAGARCVPRNASPSKHEGESEVFQSALFGTQPVPSFPPRPPPRPSRRPFLSSSSGLLPSHVDGPLPATVVSGRPAVWHAAEHAGAVCDVDVACSNARPCSEAAAKDADSIHAITHVGDRRQGTSACGEDSANAAAAAVGSPGPRDRHSCCRRCAPWFGVQSHRRLNHSSGLASSRAAARPNRSRGAAVQQRAAARRIAIPVQGQLL